MTLHLVKLCVGVNSIEDLQVYRDLDRKAAGKPVPSVHTTRMIPKRKSDLLDNGSLYWVIKGVIQVRQKLIDISPFTDEHGIKRCDLILDPELVPTKSQPRRAFQGWRYLSASDAPADKLYSASDEEIPEPMCSDLSELCLI